MSRQPVVCLLDSRIHHDSATASSASPLGIEFYQHHEYFQLMKNTKIRESDSEANYKIWEMKRLLEFFDKINQNYKIRRKSKFPSCSYDVATRVKELFVNNPELFKSILKKTGGGSLYLSVVEGFLENDVLEMALNCSIRKSLILRLANDLALDDRDFVMKCLKFNGLNLKYASERLQKDYQVAMKAVKQNGKSIRYVNPIILTNELVKTALLQNPKSIVYVRNFVYKNMKDDLEIANSIRRFLSVQHVCKPKRWARSNMFERIFSIRMELRRQYSINYEETNKQEIRIWGELVSNLEGYLGKTNPKPKVVHREVVEEDDELEGFSLFA